MVNLPTQGHEQLSLRPTALSILSGTLVILFLGTLPAIWIASLYDSQTNPVLNDCDRIAVGQSRAEVESLFSKYDQSDDVMVNKGGPGAHHVYPVLTYEDSLSLYTLGLLDDYQCSVFFVDAKVARIEKIAD